MSFQETIIVGNVGRDAELSYTPQGVAVAKFSVAVTKYTGKGEDRKEKTTWFRVTMWRERAENLHQYIKKGKKVLVVGDIDASAYTNKDGAPTASLELTASDIRFLSPKDAGEGEPVGERAEESVDIPF